MTTTDASPVTAGATRTTAAAILRAVADLIEARPDIPVPGSNISFYLRGQDAPALMAAIASALPCEWQASTSRSGEYEWLTLDSSPPRPSALSGARVTVMAPAADTCVQAGARTVMVWRPAAALAGLLGTEPVSEVA